jgi:hypothetical protein
LVYSASLNGWIRQDTVRKGMVNKVACGGKLLVGLLSVFCVLREYSGQFFADWFMESVSTATSWSFFRISEPFQNRSFRKN